MKGVPIKFRGTTPNNELVFGKYLTCTHNSEGEDTVLWIGDEDNGYHIVMDDSLVQLVGYDAEGNEVYEGDIIDVFNDGKLEISFPAALTDNLFHNKSVQLLRRNDK